MKLKLALGLGLACGACCALPVILGAGALGTFGIASGNGVAMLIGGLSLIATGATFFVQHRRQHGKSTTCETDGSCGCKPEGAN